MPDALNRAVLLLGAAVLAAPAALAGFEGRTPYHGASDAVARPGEAVLLAAVFRHSAGAQKDLEHAAVRVEWELDGGWQPLGETRTDAKGRAVLAAKAPGRPGSVKVRWWFRDQPAEAVLWVVAEGQAITVFDIDGTLTPADRENLKDYARRLLRRVRAEGPRLRPHAIAAALRAANDSLPVFLTGRPPFLGRPTRDWLAFHGFPPGMVFLMPESRAAWPTESRVGQAKLDRLKELQAKGLRIVRVFGNASTDISAYEAAGVAKEATFILGKRGGERGTVALGEGFPGD
ncbi:MAG: hypothetical protein IPL96_07505 [Holophagaceae bacterium]|nr:hypothetical protein [Holophagaceae bacterium]